MTKTKKRPQPVCRVRLPEGLIVSEAAYGVRVAGDKLGTLKAGDHAILDPEAKFEVDAIVLRIVNGERDGLYRVRIAPWQPGYKLSATSEVIPAALLETLDGTQCRWVQLDGKTELHPIVGWAVA